VGTLDATALARQAGTPEGLLKVLGDAGQARILYRIDQPVNVYSERITMTGSEPVVTGTRMSRSGQPINTTMRQNVGVIARLSAQAPPKEGDHSQPTVMMAVQLGASALSDTEIAAGQKATAMRNISLQHSEPLEFGHPQVVVAVRSASAGEQTTPTVYVVRYMFNPLGGM